MDHVFTAVTVRCQTTKTSWHVTSMLDTCHILLMHLRSVSLFVIIEAHSARMLSLNAVTRTSTQHSVSCRKIQCQSVLTLRRSAFLTQSGNKVAGKRLRWMDRVKEHQLVRDEKDNHDSRPWTGIRRWQERDWDGWTEWRIGKGEQSLTNGSGLNGFSRQLAGC